jgi:hypothetical protein
VLPGLVVFGLGLPLVGVSNQVADAPDAGAGAASGIVATAFHVGGALGLAVISTAATSRVGAFSAPRVKPDAALVAEATAG